MFNLTSYKNYLYPKIDFHWDFHWDNLKVFVLIICDRNNDFISATIYASQFPNVCLKRYRMIALSKFLKPQGPIFYQIRHKEDSYFSK